MASIREITDRIYAMQHDSDYNQDDSGDMYSDLLNEISFYDDDMKSILTIITEAI